MASDFPVTLSGDDIMRLIAETHMINAGIFEAMGTPMARQASVIEGLEPDPSPAVMVLRDYLVRALRGEPRPTLRVIKGGRDLPQP